MRTDLRKAAEMALEALEEAASCVQNSYLPDSMGHDWDEQIEALRQALNVDAVNISAERVHKSDKSIHEKEWVGLTREEINGLARWADEHAAPFYLEFAKAIEAKLKEKNG